MAQESRLDLKQLYTNRYLKYNPSYNMRCLNKVGLAPFFGVLGDKYRVYFSGKLT